MTAALQSTSNQKEYDHGKRAMACFVSCYGNPEK